MLAWLFRDAAALELLMLLTVTITLAPVTNPKNKLSGLLRDFNEVVYLVCRECSIWNQYIFVCPGKIT